MTGPRSYEYPGSGYADEDDPGNWGPIPERSSVPGACPDGGTCHHGCPMVDNPTEDYAAEGLPCWRVRACGPLSNVFPDDHWPADVKAAHAAMGEEK